MLRNFGAKTIDRDTNKRGSRQQMQIFREKPKK